MYVYPAYFSTLSLLAVRALFDVYSSSSAYTSSCSVSGDGEKRMSRGDWNIYADFCFPRGRDIWTSMRLFFTIIKQVQRIIRQYLYTISSTQHFKARNSNFQSTLASLFLSLNKSKKAPRRKYEGERQVLHHPLSLSLLNPSNRISFAEVL